MGLKTILLQITREIQFIKSLQPNIIVSDSRASTIIAAKLLKFPIVLITNQTRIEIARDMGKPHSIAEKAFQFIIKISWFFLKHIILFPKLNVFNESCTVRYGKFNLLTQDPLSQALLSAMPVQHPLSMSGN